MTNRFFLVVNKEVFAHSVELDKLIEFITGFNIHTKFYGANIDSEKVFWEFFDLHEGVYSSFDELLDDNNKAQDVYIIQEHYVDCYPDAIEIVDNYLEENNLPQRKKAND